MRNFIDNLLGLSVSNLVRFRQCTAFISISDSFEMTKLRNWSKNFSISSKDYEIIHVKEEKDIIDAVLKAKKDGTTLRAVGNLLSWPPITKPPKKRNSTAKPVVLCMSEYNQIVRIEGTVVTVQAGMNGKHFLKELKKRNLMLTSLGNVVGQTIVGEFLTGSHGKSLYHPCLSGMVLKWRLVTSDGQILEVEKDSELANAVGVSLGMLGVVSTVDIQCEELAPFSLVEFSVTFDEFVKMWEGGINAKHQYVDYVWWPLRDTMRIQLIDRVNTNDTTTASITTANFKPGGVLTKVFQSLLFIGSFVSPVLPVVKLIHTPFAKAPTRTHVSSLDNIVAERQHIAVKYSEMEPAIPMDRAVEAFQALKRAIDKHKKVMYFPIGIRVVKADNFWLSPAYSRDSVYIAVLANRWGLTQKDKMFALVRDALKPFGLRYHWGKYVNVDPEYLRQQYPRLKDFAELRLQMDPQRMFSNDYLDQYVDL